MKGEKMEKDKLIKEINRLKKEKNALILAHNYQIPEIQEVADILGDSLKLSIEAAKTDKDMIVFCGVQFMAESAKLLSPEKVVLLPNDDAGCPMADMMTVEKLKELKQKHPNAPVVTYVNSNTEIKAMSDVCCTSSSAVDIVEKLDSDKIIFGPDRNLGSYVQKFSDKEIILWDGFCPTHEAVTPEEVKEMKEKYPEAKVMVHPEARPAVVKIADFVGSTSQMIDYAKREEIDKYLVGTEKGILNIMRNQNPDKEFILLSEVLICPNMKKTNLEILYISLKEEKYKIHIDSEMAQKAKKALDKMLELS